MLNIHKAGPHLQEGDKILFWCFGNTPAEIVKIFPIKTPFPFITHAMRLRAEFPDGTTKVVESSVEHGMYYEVVN